LNESSRRVASRFHWLVYESRPWCWKWWMLHIAKKVRVSKRRTLINKKWACSSIIPSPKKSTTCTVVGAANYTRSIVGCGSCDLWEGAK
jgi:hypothetical protein